MPVMPVMEAAWWKLGPVLLGYQPRLSQCCVSVPWWVTVYLLYRGVVGLWEGTMAPFISDLGSTLLDLSGDVWKKPPLAS